MTEKTEWVVIDEREQPQERVTTQQLLRRMFGRYWRWKLAGFIVLASIVLVISAAFVGAIVVVLSASAIVLFVAAKFRRWLQRGSDRRLPTDSGNEYF